MQLSICEKEKGLDKKLQYLYNTNNFVVQRKSYYKDKGVVNMSNTLDLKQIERKAFLSTFQDGLLDIHMGVIVIVMGMFAFRPTGGYSAINIIGFTLIAIVVQILFLAGKKYITLPRMGQVKFGPARQQKNRNLAIILGIIVVIQVAVVGLTSLGWFNPVLGAKLFSSFGNLSLERLPVAGLGSLFVGPSMLVIAYLIDFLRGYYIAVLMALAVFLIILINQPIYPVVIGGLIIIPGLVLFIQFLRKYPIPQGDESNG